MIDHTTKMLATVMAPEFWNVEHPIQGLLPEDPESDVELLGDDVGVLLQVRSRSPSARRRIIGLLFRILGLTAHQIVPMEICSRQRLKEVSDPNVPDIC
ncbi:hypothetical protein N7517_003944 [Penicillium concentricum]|uniref:Uncharacterized protein n=1 Tax=Penicillium concentricum TaxID=293559 RepID=A0A9W9S998_9EURO|nr:uncharacterized protein N7517_003944 [Penicillium concentricum]KAJ5371938.1 hypothetical protein N7517_003944 [Penicillium concentricum]